MMILNLFINMCVYKFEKVMIKLECKVNLEYINALEQL